MPFSFIHAPKTFHWHAWHRSVPRLLPANDSMLLVESTWFGTQSFQNIFQEAENLAGVAGFFENRSGKDRHSQIELVALPAQQDDRRTQRIPQKIAGHFQGTPPDGIQIQQDDPAAVRVDNSQRVLRRFHPDDNLPVLHREHPQTPIELQVAADGHDHACFNGPSLWRIARALAVGSAGLAFFVSGICRRARGARRWIAFSFC